MGELGRSPQLGINSFCDKFSYVFCGFHAFHNLFTPPKTPFSQQVLFRLLGFLMDFDSPDPKTQFPNRSSSLLGGNKGFPQAFIDTGA